MVGSSCDSVMRPRDWTGDFPFGTFKRIFNRGFEELTAGEGDTVLAATLVLDFTILSGLS
jgi:hypothetical protein